MTFSSTRPNLSIDAQGSNDGVKPGGIPIERIITVRNRGTVKADIDLWIRPNDAKSNPLIRWCTLTAVLPGELEESSLVPQEREQGFSGVRLPQVAPRESCQVILRFTVPPQAEPGFYNYDVLAQSLQYPGEQSSRNQQLRVLAAKRTTGLQDDPSWTLEPATSSDAPYSLKVGSTLRLKVLVQNRTDVVDRYHLRCPELDDRWYDIEYPENSEVPVLVNSSDGLMLNPGETGEISLIIHPPAHTPAGYYSSTLRLISFVRDNLVLLDIVYLSIEVDDRLVADLQPLSRRVPSVEQWFNLSLNNPGNITRDITVVARDEGNLFIYNASPDSVQIGPGQSQNVTITPKPRKWWRRSWRGKELEVAFSVGLLNVQPQMQPEEAGASPPLPASDVAIGKILWQSRSPWIRRLLLLFLSLLLLAGVGWLVYWLLREFVVEPSLEPRVLEFVTAAESYQAEQGNPIRLDWEISNPDQAGRAIVTYYADNGQAIFSQPYPFEELQEEESTCEPGTFRPNLLVRLIRQVYRYPAEVTTLTCLGVSPQPIATDSITNRTTNNIENGVAKGTEENSLFVPGDYQVKLDVFSEAAIRNAADSQSLKPSDTERLKPIKLTPPPPPPAPEVLYLYSKSPIYRQPGGVSESSAASSPQYPSSPIQLNWIVNNAEDIEVLELSYVNVASDGEIQNNQVRYAMQSGIPVGLEDACRLQEQRLICEDVPTVTEASGKYTFTLNVIMPEGRNTTRIAKDSEAIEIRPPLPQIQSFNVNGQDVLENPQIVQTINPARGPVQVSLNWQVPDPSQVKVELLPAPGAIDPSKTSMDYTLSPTPGNTMLTLQVTNRAGETVSRSVTIQTTAFTAPASPSPATSSPTPPPPPDVAVPGSPVSPEELPVFELPPRSN